MGPTRTALLTVGVAVLLTGSASAQYGPLGRMSSVQPGVPRSQAPRATGYGPYGGAFAALPPRPNALGSASPTNVITAPSRDAGAFAGGSPFRSFGFAPGPFAFGPSILGNGTPFVSSPQFGVNVTAFPGAGVFVNTGQFAPSTNLTVNNIISTPAIDSGARFDRFLGGSFGGLSSPTPARGAGPFGGAGPVAPRTSSPTSGATANGSPAFARFFSGLPGAAPANGVQSTAAPR